MISPVLGLRPAIAASFLATLVCTPLLGGDLAAAPSAVEATGGSPGGAPPAWAGDRDFGGLERRHPRPPEHPTAFDVPLAARLASPMDGEWIRMLQPSAPGPARLTHSSIHDPLRDRMVIFGGSDGAFHNDVWTLSLGSSPDWSLLEVAGTPPSPRRLQTAIYDPIGDRMILFGGVGASFYADVWELSLSAEPPTWTKLLPAGPLPVARAGHAAVYDPTGHRMIVLAGYDGASPPSQRRSDVWALSLGSPLEWTELTPATPGPTARSSLEAVYDPVRHRVVIFGGTDPTFRNDAWALSLSEAPSWSPIDVSGTLPAPREEHSATYDPTGDRVIVYGGYDLEYDYADTWALPLSEPSAWVELDTGGATPGPLWGHVAVFHPAGQRLVLHGGYGLSGYSARALALDLAGESGWNDLLVSPSPGPFRYGYAADLDPERRRYVLFGGTDFHEYQNDTWVLSLDGPGDWTPLATVGTPPAPRRLCEGIFDARRDRLLVFGGFDGTFYDDVWELSFATDPPTWSELWFPDLRPAARGGHAATYDPVGDRLIVFGGYDGVSRPARRRNDVWALSLSGTMAWTEITPRAGPRPSPRSSHSLVYDSRRHRMVAFGGTSLSFLNDVWALPLGGDAGGGRSAVSVDGQGETPGNGPGLMWTRLEATGTPPAPREEQSAIYDPLHDQLVVFAGYDASLVSLDDTWALSLGGPVEWTRLQPAGPSPPPRWGHTAVYDAASDRMILHSGIGFGFNDTWALARPDVVLPERIGFESASGGPTDASRAVVWAAPNPGRPGRVVLSCRLAGAEPATLRVVDVRGRLVERREIEGGGGSTAQVAMSAGLPAGLYFVSLSQAERTSSIRVLLIP